MLKNISLNVIGLNIYRESCWNIVYLLYLTVFRDTKEPVRGLVLGVS